MLSALFNDLNLENIKHFECAIPKNIKNYDTAKDKFIRDQRPQIRAHKNVQVADTSQHQLFRRDCGSGLHGWIAAKKPLLWKNNKKKRNKRTNIIPVDKTSEIQI